MGTDSCNGGHFCRQLIFFNMQWKGIFSLQKVSRLTMHINKSCDTNYALGVTGQQAMIKIKCTSEVSPNVLFN